jgi:hypothetical protein
LLRGLCGVEVAVVLWCDGVELVVELAAKMSMPSTNVDDLQQLIFDASTNLMAARCATSMQGGMVA